MDTPTYLRVKTLIPAILLAAADLWKAIVLDMERDEIAQLEDRLDEAVCVYARARKGITP